MKGVIGIKTPEKVTIEGLYELMQREGNFELPYETHGKGIMQTIRFPLYGNNIIQVAAQGKSISVSVTKASNLKDIGVNALTNGWSNVFDSSRKDNHLLVEEIAAEIRRITGGK